MASIPVEVIELDIILLELLIHTPLAAEIQSIVREALINVARHAYAYASTAPNRHPPPYSAPPKGAFPLVAHMIPESLYG